LNLVSETECGWTNGYMKLTRVPKKELLSFEIITKRNTTKM